MIIEQNLFNLAVMIQETSGSIKKGKVVEEYQYDNDLLKYFEYLLDPDKTYGIQKKKLDKALESVNNGKTEDIPTLNNIFVVFDYLLKNNTGTDKDALVVAKYINSMPSEMHDWLIKSITKTFKMGVTIKSVNKALKRNLITEFEIQRGKSYADHWKKYEKDGKVVTEKYNGIRCILFKAGSTIVFKTRQNKVINGLVDLTLDVANLEDGVYEGELVVKNRHDYKLRDVLQATMKIVSSDETDKKLDWFIFDHLTIEEYSNPENSRKFFQRLADNPIRNHVSENIHMADILYQGTSHEKIVELLHEVVARGGEGLMVNLNKPYKKGKTEGILKVKKKYTSDLRIVGFEEGKSTGKHVGTLGAFLLEYKGNIVKCGIMPDNVRHEAWNDKEKYLNAIVEIEHEQESGNQKNDLLSLEYPVYQQMRWEKEDHSYAHGED